MIPLMEEILHHLVCINPVNIWKKTAYQLVQDFFHQQNISFLTVVVWRIFSDQTSNLFKVPPQSEVYLY